MPIIVYKMDASPPARTVLITAEILGLDIETRELNVLKGEQHSVDYLEKNPVHTIPLLEDEDFVLSDSHAISIYLLSKYGKDETAELYPSDLKERAIVNQRLFLDASILFPNLLAIARDIRFNKAVEVDEKKIASVKEAYGFLEKYLERTQFVAGNNITLADIACVTTVSTLNVMVAIEGQFPKVQAWLEVLSQQDWYKKKNQPGLNAFEGFFIAMIKENAK